MSLRGMHTQMRMMRRNPSKGQGYSRYDKEGRVIYYERRDFIYGSKEIVQYFYDYDSIGRRTYYAVVEHDKIILEEFYQYDTADLTSNRTAYIYQPQGTTYTVSKQLAEIDDDDGKVKYRSTSYTSSINTVTGETEINGKKCISAFLPFPIKQMRELGLKTDYYEEWYDLSNYK